MSLPAHAESGQTPASSQRVMSQTARRGSDNIMHCTSQSKDTQNSFIGNVCALNNQLSRSSSGGLDNSSIMHLNANQPYSNTSGTSSPVSVRSSTSFESNVPSSTSSSSGSRPKRSSMKPSLKTSTSIAVDFNKMSSPPNVRFADPELAPRSHKRPPLRPKSLQPEPLVNKVPNPMLRSRHSYASSLSGSASGSMRNYGVTQAYGALPPLSVPAPLSQRGSVQVMNKRISSNISPPAPPLVMDTRWSGIPLPAHFSPPVVTWGSRVASYQSTFSDLSVQSAPAVLLTCPTAAASQGQYNPLQHYVPCLYLTCSVHYTPSHAGPTCYLPQGSYSLPRLHAHCPRHASQELKEANAFCKREYESLRQHAGRKTLGLIATEFEIFLEQFREDRRLEDAKLQREQKQRVLGVRKGVNAMQDKGKARQDDQWEWKYTPRPCTKRTCTSVPYSPYANHLYAFYTSPRPSKFLPLQNLCPTCSNAEVEAFERNIREKWSSRCGWDDTEWNEWFTNATTDRDTEGEFWREAQARVVREKGPARWVERLVEEEEVPVVEKKGKKSLFKRLFGSMVA